jgi:hypothetical protein
MRISVPGLPHYCAEMAPLITGDEIDGKLQFSQRLMPKFSPINHASLRFLSQGTVRRLTLALALLKYCA